VRLGLFIDLRNPVGWRRPWHEHYRRTVERVAEAERLGLDSVWLTEHHFFDDGYLPQPLAFAAAIAATTSRIRVGTAVLLAAVRDPLHVAEEATIVDLVSGGRLDLGLGAGWSKQEYAAFGADIGHRYELTERALMRIRAILDDESVTPSPLQRPVPLWLGYQGPKGARRAGRLGVGLLSMDRGLLAPYLAGLEEGGHDPSLARMAGLAEIVVADDPDSAYERILPYYVHQLNSYRRARTPTATALTPEQVRARGGLQVLTPADAVTVLREHTAGLPVADVRLWMSIAGMPDDLVDRHVELTASHVRPALVEGGS
jgi:alkanesulfonate monooxygenase SsuD/methylene tetrahydromethanopterin reductase-like flavin-dependent oxidoreductase (luciferase family)